MTPAEAVAKLRAEREKHPYTEWAMASMVLEAEHAHLLREAIDAAKKLEAMEENLNRLRGVARSLASLAAMGAFYRLLAAGPPEKAAETTNG